MAPTSPATNTRDQILDAAEVLFARHGYSASLRQVTAAAGVNLAAVHYHFGSKEGLLRALFDRRLGPINKERMERLEAAVASAAPKPPAVEDVVRAMIAPVIASGLGPESPYHHFRQLIGRAHAEQSDEMTRLFKASLADVIQRFIEALAAALPHLPREELFWRMHFAAGAFAHLLTCHEKVHLMSDGLCTADDPDAMVTRLASFVTAGMEAPVPPGISGKAAPASRQRESRRRKRSST